MKARTETAASRRRSKDGMTARSASKPAAKSARKHPAKRPNDARKPANPASKAPSRPISKSTAKAPAVRSKTSTAPARAKAASVAPARRSEPAATPDIAEAKPRPVAPTEVESVAPVVAAAPTQERAEPVAKPAPATRAQGFADVEQSAAPAPPRSAAAGSYPPGSALRVMQRPMAAPETFAAGDHVVYPTHGVGKVERIAVEEIAGHRLELIHITFEENRMTLRVPVAKARSAGLRKLASREMFDKALDVLRGRARIKRTMWSRRAQEYEAKINSGDPLAIAEVVRDLHRNAGQPDQSFSERQIYENAMDRLGAELAALDQTDKVTAALKLAEFLKTV